MARSPTRACRSGRHHAWVVGPARRRLAPRRLAPRRLRPRAPPARNERSVRRLASTTRSATRLGSSG
eukprot:4119447-Heterocapsa_arctica.AAC.1